MKVLIACEESQRVCMAFREKGHEAYSCDIQDCSGGHPEWHIKQDVIPLLNGYCSFKTVDGREHCIDGKWDLIIAHPPCTHLSSSGQWAYKKGKDINLKFEGIKFFMEFVKADCEKIAIENPIGVMSTEYRKPDQIIQPWMFGDKAQKSTCLWLKGLPLLTPTDIVEKGEFFEWTDKNGKKKRQAKYDLEILRKAKSSEERSRLRSVTFQGIANAMADQWGGELMDSRWQLKAFAVQNNCDAVLLTDGTIKKFMGERSNATTIYKLKDNKFYDWEIKQ